MIPRIREAETTIKALEIMEDLFEVIDEKGNKLRMYACKK